jgi:hypothetical protein
LGQGYDLRGMQNELREYRDILLGRQDPPIDHGVMTLMECAEAFHARAKEMEQELLDMEAENAILKGSRPYKFRVGFLRSFIEMTSKTIDLGSRRVTYERDLANGRG